MRWLTQVRHADGSFGHIPAPESEGCRIESNRPIMGITNAREADGLFFTPVAPLNLDDWSGVSD